MHFLASLSAFTALSALVSAETIADINGPAYISPLLGRSVTNVTGVVTAKSANGIFLRSTVPDDDDRTSESIFVFDKTQVPLRSIGELISLNGLVTEFKSNPAYVSLTQISSPSNVQSSGNGTLAPPLILGTISRGTIGVKDLSPPTEEYSSLDGGDIFAVPNDVSQITGAKKALEPDLYNMDFWESIMAELVTIPAPVAASRPNNFGETWIYGNYTVTGLNSRGGLTQVGSDANGEAIIVGTPLDGTKNPNDTRLGDSLGDITGVIYQQFGFYYILPTTAITTLASAEPALPPPTELLSEGACSALTFGQYNVENLSPNSTSITGVAGHISQYLKSPAVMFLQEIQDNNGPVNDAIVDASLTLTTLTNLIQADGGTKYGFVDIPPVHDTNGGEPGGNIRASYLFDPHYVSLLNPNPGNSTASTAIIAQGPYANTTGPTLTLNPGLLSPNDPAWSASRKPLVAQWQTADEQSTFFTINLHLTSKGGSSSLQGDPRPPVNGGVTKRLAQLTIVGNFVARILALDPEAAIIVAGDFNEFDTVAPVTEFERISGLVNINVAAGLDPVERYTYLFGQNCQELDQMFVSPKIAGRSPKVEHVHVNTWVKADEVVSDHDPSVALLDICA